MMLFQVSSMRHTLSWCQMRTCLSSVKFLVTQIRCNCHTGVITQSATISTYGDNKHLTSSSKQILGQQRRGLTDDVGLHKLHQPLTHRGLVRMSGADSASFLQGLITNDMNRFDPSRGTVDLVDASDEYQIMAVFPENYTEALRVCNTSLTSDGRPSVLACNRDPRLPSFGCRLVLPADLKGSSAIVNSKEVPDSSTYHVRRYMVGLPEGPLDLPPGHCTPLESNAVFLNGVSFTKGCYLGQELTARTHYTGVIRKRLIPVTFTSEEHRANPGDTIATPEGKIFGKLRNSVGKHGLALLRVAEVTEHQGTLLVKNGDDDVVGEVTTRLPYWWPQQEDSNDIIKDVLRSTSDNKLWSTLK